MIRLEFKKYLLEASMLPDQDKLREVIQRLVANDKNWLDKHEFVVGDKGDHWILNYGLTDANDYNKLTRGLIVRKPPTGWSGDPLKLILSFPFTRFFNKHEGPADNVNFGNAEMIEKLDGTMVGVYFPDRDPASPRWHTRKMSSDHEKDMGLKITSFHGGTYDFMPLIGKYVKQVPFEHQDTFFTYVFEFIHAASHVVTKYQDKDFGLYLIGGRNLVDHHELSEAELDHVAARLNVRRPRRWDSIADHNEILAMMKKIEKETPNFEGFVFRDRETGKRVKVKDPDYVRIHHMINDLRYKNLIISVLNGEESEILSYFPSAKERIETIKNKYAEYVDSVAKRVRSWQATPYRAGELAARVKGRPAKRWDRKAGGPLPAVKAEESDRFAANQILKNINVEDDEALYKNIDKELRDMALGHNVNPKKLVRLIGLEDEDDEDT